MTAAYAVFDTALGQCAIAWRGGTVAGFMLPGPDAERGIRRKFPALRPGTPPQAAAAVIAAALRYFAGERVDFSGVALDLEGQDPFRVQVYAAARRVGWGETTTYGALARQVGGGPETARDVGQAMAGNPVPLIIPCHRVLAAGGRIGGFSAPGGSAAKQRMLALEGVHAGPAQRTLF
jgi:methylated-DNA-[protein]-cysteine S-methyltransferase